MIHHELRHTVVGQKSSGCMYGIWCDEISKMTDSEMYSFSITEHRCGTLHYRVSKWKRRDRMRISLVTASTALGHIALIMNVLPP